MHTVFERSVACRACGSENCKQDFTLSRGPVFLCSECGSYSAPDSAITPNQERDFYSTIDVPAYKEYFQDFRSGQFREVLQKLPISSPATLLDVGTSFGWMVEVGVSLGFDSYGIEPGDVPHDPALDGRIFRQTLETFSAGANRKFDVITTWHCLEHMLEPASAVEQMAELLSESGVLVIGVPTSDGLVFKTAWLMSKCTRYNLVLEELFYTHNPNMHYNYPNLRSIEIMLRNAGFDIISHTTMECFDWSKLWKRGSNSMSRFILWAAAPFASASKFTQFDNLVIVARKSNAQVRR